MSYPMYEERQDSGVEWLGFLPTSWSTRRLKFLIEDKITDGPHETPIFTSEGIPFLSVDGIQNGELIFDGCRHISLEAHEIYRRKAAPIFNDILLGKAASTGKIARVKVHFEFSIWSPLALIRPNRKIIDPAFVEYAFKSDFIQAQIEVLCTSNTQKNISMDDIPVIIFPLPPLPEQYHIVAFLNTKTAEIDDLIALKERQVALLQQKRKTLISRAVTKGLDSHAPMHDSGVTWLGEVPEEWQLTRVKFVVHSIQTGPFGSQLHAIDYVENGIPVINPSNLQAGKIIPDQRMSIDQDTFNRLSRHVLLKDDIVCARRGELGRCGLVTEYEQGWLCGTGSLRVRPDITVSLPEYLTAQLSLQRVKEWLSLSSIGSTMDNLNTEILANVPIVLPSLKQQQEIIIYLDRETAHIDTLVALVQEQIEKLRIYRQALITAAVTGKIDVRGAVQ
jgi:type I restriction enzyme, S subunit